MEREVLIEWDDQNCGQAETEVLRSSDSNQTNDSFVVVGTVAKGKTKFVDVVEDSDSGISYYYRVRAKIGTVRSTHVGTSITAVTVKHPNSATATLLCL